VFLVGGGPSLKKVNLSLIKNERVIGINNAYQLGSWVDVCWFTDSRWFDWHKEKLLNFAGLKVHCVNRLKYVGWLKRLLRGKPMGIEKNPGVVSWNKCSGSSAINLAYHFGAKRVVLIGYDMQRVDDEANWHSDHPYPKKDPYDNFLKCFPSIAKDAEELGLEIINATPGSLIDVFPITTLEEAIHASNVST